MLIVSDTGPLRYLIETDAIDALPRLYGSVLTTPTVIGEMQLPHFPPEVQQWAQKPPPWLTIEPPKQVEFLNQLDAGEASAISLAVERHADAVLIDERGGTAVARSNGLKTIGTLAVLIEAGLAGCINFHDTLRRLTQQTRFRYSQSLIDQVAADFDQEMQRRQLGGPGTQGP